jgi:hypothetical protein
MNKKICLINAGMEGTTIKPSTHLGLEDIEVVRVDEPNEPNVIYVLTDPRIEMI